MNQDLQLRARETSLKALLEGMGVGAAKENKVAEMTLKTYKHFEGIKYDEAMTLVKELNGTIEHMSPLDVAFVRMVEERNGLLKWAGALNDFGNMGRHDHEYPVHVLVSVGDVTVEAHIHIPQLYHSPSTRNRSILAKIVGCINSASDWTPSRRFPADVDFVELS